MPYLESNKLAMSRKKDSRNLILFASAFTLTWLTRKPHTHTHKLNSQHTNTASMYFNLFGFLFGLLSSRNDYGEHPILELCFNVIGFGILRQ